MDAIVWEIDADGAGPLLDYTDLLLYLKDMFARDGWVDVYLKEIRYQEIKLPIHKFCPNFKSTNIIDTNNLIY